MSKVAKPHLLKSLLPGATLGVIGGGQLGRMFVQAAQAMGYFTAVLDPDPNSPAGQLAHFHILTDYQDDLGLDQLMQRCDAITTEFENVPAAALRRLAAQRPTSPAADAVAVCQDRSREKAQFLRCAVPCAPHALIDSLSRIETLGSELFPAILKTNRLGYDGRGQLAVANRQALRSAWLALGDVACLLEKRLPLRVEISAIVARGATGEVVHLPVQQNLHRDGILAMTQVPAPDVPAPLQLQAIEAATRLAHSMGYVGVLCVEFFVLEDGTLVANEMAPRPHNSGHYSINACDLSQFDLQVRALAGLPLVMPRLHSPAVMLNLLGDLWFCQEPTPQTQPQPQPPQPPQTPQAPQAPQAPQPPDWSGVLALPGAHLHLYAKLEPMHKSVQD